MTALQKDVLCRDAKDYLFLWNSIVICAASYGITIFCICLMSNHFHILLQAPKEKIDLFFERLKIRYGRYLKKRYGKTLAPYMEYRLFDVPDRKAFCRETAYILRNAYKARLNSPLSYPWSSVLAYFQSLNRSGRRVANISVRERRTLLQTKRPIPGTLLVSPDGMILPESFVDKAFTERMFGNSAIQFFDLLRKWNLGEIVDSMHGETVIDAYSDEEVSRGIRELCQDVFGNIEPHQMDPKTLARLILRIHARFGASRPQLQRLLPVDSYLLDRLL